MIQLVFHVYFQRGVNCRVSFEVNHRIVEKITQCTPHGLFVIWLTWIEDLFILKGYEI